MTSAELLTKAETYLYPNYKPARIVFARGKGSELFDVEGKRYLDLAAGVAVCAVGHAHPDHAKAIADQAATLIHVSNYFYNDVNVRLAEALCQRAGMAKAFFCNSGAEANEAALKLARRHFFAKGQPSRSRIIAFHSAFHGRTLGALSMTGTPKYKEGFGAPGGVSHVTYGDLDAVKAEMKDDVCAIVVEPLQGEGGVIPAPAGFLAGLRELCDRAGALLLMDEVQTGIGRLGAWFGFQRAGVRPDAITLAKGLGGGVPIGACLATDSVARAFGPGTHASTFGGNPLACAAALAVLRVLLEGKILDQGRRMGECLAKGLATLKERHRCVKEVRGLGLLQGMELEIDGKAVVADCLTRGLLINCVGDRVLRFVPSLIITEREIDRLLAALSQIFSQRTTSTH